MGIPRISHKAFAILASLGESETSGPELRKRLRAIGWKTAGSGFYRFIGRMIVKGGLITVRHEAGRTNELPIAHYTITTQGIEERDQCKAFYKQLEYS